MEIEKQIMTRKNKYSMISFLIASIPAVVFWLASLGFFFFGPHHTHDYEFMETVWMIFTLFLAAMKIAVVPSVVFGIMGIKSDKKIFSILGIVIAIINACVPYDFLHVILSKMGC